MEENIEIQETQEEIVKIQLIESADYCEKKFFCSNEMDVVIDYIIESSISVGKKLITKYNYEEVQGGYACKGVKLTIEDF